jgi:hypothetical protein
VITVSHALSPLSKRSCRPVRSLCSWISTEILHDGRQPD